MHRLPAIRPRIAVNGSSRLFGRRFIEELEKLHDADQLRFVGDDATLAEGTAFAGWLARPCRYYVRS